MEQESNIFTSTISCLRSNAKVADLLQHFKDQLRMIKMRNVRLDPQAILKKYHTLTAKYQRGSLPSKPRGWHENERKLFLWFLFAYYHLNFKKYSEITSKEWREFSECFGNKDVLLLRYEAVALERNSQRVYWSPPEEGLLKELVKSSVNGKWGDIARELFFRSEGQHYKTPKQCREHWFNHLSTDIRKGAWTIEEDLAILTFVQTQGRHWSRLIDEIGRVRTEHMAKNRYGSLIHFARKYCNAMSESNSNDEQVLISSLIDYLNSHKALIYDDQAASSPEQPCKSDKSISLECPEVKEEALVAEEKPVKVPTSNRLTQQSINADPELNSSILLGAVYQGKNYNKPSKEQISLPQQQINQSFSQQLANQPHQLSLDNQQSIQEQPAVSPIRVLPESEGLIGSQRHLVQPLSSPLLYTVANHMGYTFSTVQLMQPMGIINYVIPFVAQPPQQPQEQNQENPQ